MKEHDAIILRQDVRGQSVIMTAVRAGCDLSIICCGGEKPHIGGVAISIPRKSLLDDETLSATTSVINITGHKEGELLQYIANTCAVALACVVTVSGGIHFDRLEQAGIIEIQEAVESLTDSLIQRLEG